MAHKTPLAAVAIKFGGWHPSGMLLGGTDNAVDVPLAIKFTVELPAGMLLAGGGA